MFYVFLHLFQKKKTFFFSQVVRLDQSSCLAFSFQLICRWKQVVIGHSGCALRAHFAIMVAEWKLSPIHELRT